MQSQPNELYFATPAIWLPGMSEEEWQASLASSFQRSLLTRDFVDGKISPDDFADGLNDHLIDVFPLIEDWDNGISHGM